MSTSRKNILILMSGSIACYKVCGLVSQLVQNQFSVEVVLSESAQKFIGAATIEGLTGKAPHLGTFDLGQAMAHIHLERWADLILVAPATANTINKMAHGVGDDLISTLFLAHDFKKPFLIAPAMNTMMYQHPTTQNSIAKLKDMNCKILEAASGVLACGEVGYGRLLEPTLLYQEILSHLGSDAKPTNPVLSNKIKKTVVITAGGTEEPIDDVRVITNSSTGTTGAFLADQLIESGLNIIYLSSEKAKKPKNCSQEQIQTFKTFDDLDQLLARTLKENNCDVVIHAAAVSDYSVAAPSQGKISSQSEKLTIELKRNPKLISKIKKISPNTKLFGFKLTSTPDIKLRQEKVSKLFSDADCDWVIQNDWESIKQKKHVFNLYSPNGLEVENINLESLSLHLFNRIMETL